MTGGEGVTLERFARVSEPDGSPRRKTVVCVTDQKRCDRIIHAGRALADLSGTELAVINVAHPDYAQDPDSIEYLFSVSKQNGAELMVLYDENVNKAIVRYIKQSKVAYVVTGIPQEGDSVVTDLWCRFTHVTFFVAEQGGELREIVHPVRAARAVCESRA